MKVSRQVQFIDGKKLLNSLIYNSRYNKSQIGTKLGISNYIYEITSEVSTKRVSRDHLIAILITIQCDLKTFNKVLQLFEYSKLYEKSARDSIILSGIKDKLELIEIDNILFSQNFPCIIKKN